MVGRSLLLLLAAFGIAAWMPAVAGLSLTKLENHENDVTVLFPRAHYANTVYFFVESGPDVKGKNEKLIVTYQECTFTLSTANDGDKLLFQLTRSDPLATNPPKAKFSSAQGFAFKVWGPNLYYGSANGSPPSFLRCVSASDWCQGVNCTAHLTLTKSGNGIGLNVSVLHADEVRGYGPLKDTSGFVAEKKEEKSWWSTWVIVGLAILILLIVIILALLIAGIIGFLIGRRNQKRGKAAPKKGAAGPPARSPAAAKDQGGFVTQAADGGVTQGVTQGGVTQNEEQVTEKQTATPANTPGPASNTPAQTPKNNGGGLEVKTVRY